MSTSHQVNTAIARFDEVMGRIDRTAASRAADERQFARSSRVWLHRAIGAAIAVGLVMAATTVIGVILNGIGLGGFVLSLVAMAAAALYFLVPRREKPIVDYRDDMPNQAVVQRLDSLLVRKRAALPSSAARRLDAISQQLPLLENRLRPTQ